MKREIIHTPATVEEAVARLTDLERLLMAKGWERAAILATIVRLDNTAGRKPNRRNPVDYLTPGELVKRRIPGLLDNMVIQTYVQRWLDANHGRYPAPDTELVLPDSKWPPVDKNDAGSRATPSSIGRQMMEKPELAEAAARGLADGAIRHVTRDQVRDLGRSVDERRVRDLGADPNPPRIRDRGRSTDELADDAYWGKVRQALHLLLDVKVRIAHGETIPGDISILMQILVPESDWDEALRDEIGNLT